MPKRSQLEEEVQVWYNYLENNHCISEYTRDNYIIDLPLLDMELLKYLHYHARIRTLKDPTNCDDGKCCYNNLEGTNACVFRYMYFGCDGCHIKNENYIQKYNYDEDDIGRHRK